MYLSVFSTSLHPLQLWGSYLGLAVSFLTQPWLQLEKFSEQKRHKVLERYNDMRVLMGFQILSMWHNLGTLGLGRKHHYVVYH